MELVKDIYKLMSQINLRRTFLTLGLEVLRALDTDYSLAKVHRPPEERIDLTLPQATEESQAEDLELLLPTRGITQLHLCGFEKRRGIDATAIASRSPPPFELHVLKWHGIGHIQAFSAWGA